MSTLDWLNDSSQDTIPNSTVHQTRERVMKEIECSLLEVARSLLSKNPVRLPVSSSSRSKKYANSVFSFKKKRQQQRISISRPTRTVRLPGKRSAKALARYLSVLRMIYEALAYKVVVTKRDMFYRDVELFTTQKVSASSKGLIFGPILLQLKNGKLMNCMTSISSLDSHDEQGLLIPPINQVSRIYCKAKFMLIVEKEGKGYPDLSTRHFAFAFDVINLAVQSIKLIGISCRDRIQ
ncbi:Spo11/DNA topoisomerase VI subunit A [Sporodiniella umbellata]|nr:Spo11/DNA topoisomerase VI subunit A [Sporodiniella umbellata]